MKLREEGNTAAVESLVLSDPGYELWVVYDTFTKEMGAIQDDLTGQSQAGLDKAVFFSTILRFGLFLLGIPTIVLTLIRLKGDEKNRNQLFLELDKNNKKYLFDPLKEEDGEALDEEKITNSLIENLRHATEFISNITKGNFDLQWAGLNEKNKEVNKKNLSGELMQMRDQMVKVKKEDEIRLWSTEGVYKFAEIVRQYQDDLNLLADNITTNVVKWMGANQATLFFVSEQENREVVLEQKSCYAYNRKKFLTKTIEPGEGLIGQTYLEKEITYLTDVPQNYVQISSGLGGATPASLILVPLMFNDRVEGVLEIASFKKMQSHEIQFLERIGEIIASSIVTIRSSQEMKRLMDGMTIQSEDMKSQEEEMRQNMEELQATQEEMIRKSVEYQSIIEEREKELELQLTENKMLLNKINASRS